MYGRITHFKADPARLDEMVARIPTIRQEIASIAGGVVNWAMWNEDGTGATIAVYENEAVAEAATPQIQAIWGGMVELLTEPPQIASFTSAEDLRA